MLKMVVMICRKPGTTPSSFRDYYETSHSKLMKHFADCIGDYRRSYPVAGIIKGDAMYNPGGVALGVQGQTFDCITEVWLKDERALKTLYSRMAAPDLARIFLEDTLYFTDRSRTRFVICEEERGVRGLASPMFAGTAGNHGSNCEQQNRKIKLIATMKRKEGISLAEFREYYENSHTRLTHHVAEFMADYRRSYPRPNPAAPSSVYNPSGADLITPDNAPFDCMTEIWLENADAVQGLLAVMARADVAAEFAADEERFVERSQTRLIVCEECRGWQ